MRRPSTRVPTKDEGARPRRCNNLPGAFRVSCIALGSPMKKTSDYRKHVQECQALLRGARTPEERQMLLNMAETWEGLAGAREWKLAKEGKTEDD